MKTLIKVFIGSIFICCFSISAFADTKDPSLQHIVSMYSAELKNQYDIKFTCNDTFFVIYVKDDYEKATIEVCYNNLTNAYLSKYSKRTESSIERLKYYSTIVDKIQNDFYSDGFTNVDVALISDKTYYTMKNGWFKGVY